MYQYNDGGRASAGFKGTAGDCVVRAIAIATGLPYAEVYKRLAESNKTQRVTKGTRTSLAGKATARNGIYTHRKWFKDYMAELGFVYVTLVPKFGDQPPRIFEIRNIISGRMILSLRRHSAAMVDGVLMDTWDSSNEGLAKVYGYWVLTRALA